MHESEYQAPGDKTDIIIATQNKGEIVKFWTAQQTICEFYDNYSIVVSGGFQTERPRETSFELFQGIKGREQILGKSLKR